MSGHNKWSSIKHKKGISDQKKGQVFSKLGKKIAMAAKGGADPSANFKLQAVVNEARTANMPKENIERAIKRASDKDAATLKEVIIQAMGPAGVALVIEGITDNSNRTVGDVRTILSRNDFKIVPENSLNWMFHPVRNSPPTGPSGAPSAGETSNGVNKDWVALNPIEVTNSQLLLKIDKTMEELDANDDVENVYSNIK